MAQLSPQEVHLEFQIVPVEFWICDREPNLLQQSWSQAFIGIKQQNPVKCKRQSLERPLTLLRPAAAIVKLNCGGVECARNVRCLVGALGIDDVNLACVPQRLEAARQISRFVPHWDDHADRQNCGSWQMVCPCSERRSR